MLCSTLHILKQLTTEHISSIIYLCQVYSIGIEVHWPLQYLAIEYGVHILVELVNVLHYQAISISHSKRILILSSNSINLTLALLNRLPQVHSPTMNQRNRQVWHLQRSAQQCCRPYYLRIIHITTSTTAVRVPGHLVHSVRPAKTCSDTVYDSRDSHPWQIFACKNAKSWGPRPTGRQ